MKGVGYFLFAAFSLGAAILPATGAPGDLDISFGNGGVVTTAIGSGHDSVTSMVVQSDGKIVVAGYTSDGSGSDFAVVRYNPNGTLDATFNGTGKVTTDFVGADARGNGVALQSDGKIVVAGSANNGSRTNIALARYNSDGSLDPSFGAAGNGKIVTTGVGANSAANAVTVQADGKILLAGYATIFGDDFAVLRYNPDGTLDNGFGTGGLVSTSLRTDLPLNEFASSIVLQSDGKILVGGAGAVYGGAVPYYFALVRYNTDGTRDNSFSGPTAALNSAGYGTGLALQNDGKIVLAGLNYGEIDQDFVFYRFTGNGASDIGAKTGIGIGEDGASGAVVQSDGKIVLAGYSYNANSAVTDFALVRYHPDGGLDTGFHTTGKVTTHVGGGNAGGKSIALQTDGRILVAGFSYSDAKQVFTLARYLAFGALATTTPVDGLVTNNNTPLIGGTANASATVNVYLDGTNVGSTVADGAGMWSFTPPTSLADGLHAVKVLDANDITGTFSNVRTFTVDTIAPTAPVVQTPSNSAFTNNTRPFVSGTAEANATVTVYLDGAVAGTATASGVGAWSFAPQLEFADGQHTANAKATDRAGNTGVFSNTNSFLISSTTAGAPGDPDISFGNGGVVTTAIGSGHDSVTSMLVQSDGKVVVTGYTSDGSGNDFAVVRYNPNGTLDATFNGTGKVTTDFVGADARGNGVALQSDGKIVVAGSANNGSRTNIALARYNSDGSLDPSFGPAGNGKIVTTGVGANSAANAVTVQADGKILLAGYATIFGDDFAVLRYNPDGTLDNGFGTGGLVSTSLRTDLPLNEFASSIVLQSDGKILVGGAGAVYGGAVPYYFALVRYNTDGTRDNSFSGPTAALNSAGYGTGLALQNDGKIVLAGLNYGEIDQDFVFYRFTGNGASDIGAKTGIGIGEDGASGAVVQSDGKIVLAGYSYNANSAVTDFALVRYHPDGGLDTGFHTTGKVTTHVGGGNAGGKSIALQTDGRILVAGFSYSGAKQVFTLARYFGTGQPPIVKTGAASVVTKTAATLAGSVNANSLATTAHFEYGLGTNYGSVTSDQACGNGISAVNVSSNVAGLAANTTYHFRLVAVNSATLFGGTTFGADATFTTAPDPPVAVTAAATAVSSTGATLAGVVFPNGRVTSVYFDYGLTAAYSGTTPVQSIPAGTGAVNVFAPLTELMAGGTYHFRVVANNSGSPIPIEGADQSFQANDPPPTVLTGGASALTTTSARVTGSVRAHNSAAQVFFDYGTNGITFPISVGATPATVSGDAITSVSADLINLAQGVTYYYRVRAVNAGGASIGSVANLALDILSGLTRIAPAAPPAAQGFVLVTLNPPGIASGWRFVGEQQWRASGVPAVGLTTGDRQVEFRPVPGYIQPLQETVSITSGGAATLFTGEYYPSASGGATGGLTVLLKPDALADPLLPVAQRAQWRLLGENETQWRNSGVTVAPLIPGIYLVECKPVSGRTTPPPIPVAVQAGAPRVAKLTYFLADASAGTPPSVLSFETVNSDPNLPYSFVGQIRSDVGSATGFVVKPRVVATAAHVVYDDAALAYVTGLQWLFQRDAGTYEPKPQVPRGFYVFDGYAAQRTAEATPGQSSPQSQNLDAAALYFLEDAGRGGYGGYLGSDRSDNEFLLSSKSKLLVGYPVDGIPTASQGRMHATPPANVTFANAFGHTFTAADIRSSGGNSGGPLAVQFDDGKYYAAAIYLGGSAQTVVRSIDSDVIDLFNRAEASGNGGGNNTGGGISQVDTPFSGDTFATASLKVNLQPPEAVAVGAAWQLGGATLGSGDQRNNLTPGNYTVSFTAVSGFQTPSSAVVTLTGGIVASITGTYVNITLPKQDQSISFPGLPNRQIGDPAVSLGASASSGLPVSYTVVSGPASLSGNSVTPTGVGTVTIRASQAGNGSFNPAPDVDQSFSVVRANQTISFGALGNKTYGDSAFTVSATATSGLAPTFSVASGPASVSGNTVTLTGVGSVTIRASQAGNSNYNAAPDETRSFSVAKAGQSISFGALATRTYGEPPFGVSASASSGLIPTFSIVSGPATISGNTVTLTGAGTVTVRASQGGDGNYNAASSVDQGFGVNKATPAISWPAPAAITYGTALSGTQLNATANVTGTFTYTPAAGVVLGAGSQPLNVTFSPSDTTNYSTATVGQTLIVNKATLSAKAEGKTKAQGDPNPALTIHYTGFVNGDTSAAVTVPPTAATTATTASVVGSYPITLTGGSAANYNLTLQNGILFVYDGTSPVTGIQSVVGTGYVSGGTVTVTNTVIYSGTLTGLGWSVLPPNGWSYAAGGGSEGDIKPNAGDTSLLEWGWTTIPPSLVTFTYTLTVPAGTTGPQTLAALVRPRQLNTQFDVLAQPDPLTIDQVTHHSADTSHDFRFSLSELLRVIELYNTRNGTVRTGAYAVDANNFEDGFTPDAARLNTAVVSLLKYHAADLNHDGKLGLSELLRVIELYNYRNGTVRTGQYHVQAGTEDSFAPGP